MKMLVFYRSREYTNAIISSTRYKLQNMDIACSKYHSFETRKEAKQYCIDCLKKEIDTLENRIDMYQSNIKSCKDDLKKKNTLLKKYDIKAN